MNAQPKEQWPIEPQGTANMLAVANQGIASALALAQGEFQAIPRSKTVTVTMKSGGKYTFAYAPLEVILRACAPALAKYGLALTQSVIEDCVETTLMHGSGQTLSNRVKIINSDGGAQAYGSALTYARRYGITLLLCVCADDDDDANAAEGNTTEVKNGGLSPKGDLGKNVAPDKVQATVKRMLDLMEQDMVGDHDGLKKSMVILDYHEKILNPDEDLYVAVGDVLTAAKRNAWKAFVSQAKKAEKEDRLSDPSGRR
jgi:hypothetical protein